MFSDIQHNTPESNRQSAEWTERDEPTQRVERHKGQLASVLRDARGIIFIDYLEKGQTINQRVLHGVIGAFKR
jgi:lipid-binding SYLF domain-containing protein